MSKQIISEKLGEIWEFNLQKIEEIHSELVASISELEKYYAGFDTLYEKTEQIADLLSSVYSGYNVIDGFEHLKRLRAVIAAYRKRYTLEGIDFDFINKLESKISALRDKSFDEFPYLFHSMSGQTIIEETRNFDPAQFPFRWITFERNRSRFILRYDSIVVTPVKEFTIDNYMKPDIIFFSAENKMLSARDLFSGYPDRFEKPKFLIKTNEGDGFFFAAKIIKKIYAKKDIITEKIAPFKSRQQSSWSPGRVKLFGHNHIVINTASDKA